MIRNLLATTAIATLVATGAAMAQTTTPAPTTPTAPAPAAPEVKKAEGYLASNIIGETVYNGSGEDAENIGDVSDIVLDEEGNAQAIVIGVGGFLGIGEKRVAIEYDLVQWTEMDGEEYIVVETTREALEAQQEFDSAAFEPQPPEVEVGNTEPATAEDLAAAPVQEGEGEAGGEAAQTDDMAAAPADDSASTEEQDMAAAPADEQAATEEETAAAPADDSASTEEQDMAAAPADDQAASEEETAVVVTEDSASTEEQDTAAAPADDQAASEEETAAAPADDSASTEEQDMAAAPADEQAATEEETAVVVTEDSASTEEQDTAAAPADEQAATDETQTAAIDPSTLNEVQTGDIAAEDFIGTTVYGANDETIGEIGDVILSQDGQIEAVIVDVGGFLGMSEKPVAMSMESLQFLSDEDGNMYLYTEFTKEQLEAQATYDESTYAENQDEQLLRVE